MKNNDLFIPTIPQLITSLGFPARSRDKNNDKGLSPKTGMSMKVDGVEWKVTMTTLFTKEHQTDQGKYYYVYLSGSRVVGESCDPEEDFVETMGLYINIPASKFRNPKGTYPTIIKESELGHLWCVFTSSTELRDASIYVSGSCDTIVKSTVTLEITGFEIGSQSIFGRCTNTQGYTKLSGNFQLDIFPMDGSGSKLKITEGKFNLSDAFGW